MTSPADELRTAAEKIRSLATAATPGPWTPDASIPYGHRIGSSDDADWIAWTGEHGETGSQADADYIAAMGPNVGLALADWLEQAADAFTGQAIPNDEPALAVARALNGGQP